MQQLRIFLRYEDTKKAYMAALYHFFINIYKYLICVSFMK